MPLERLTIIHEKYAIGRALEPSGLLWIEYKAFDLKTDDAVLLSEYFPRPLAERSDDGTVTPKGDSSESFLAGRRAFIDEAKALCSIGHINIAPAIDYVEDFGTAFCVFKRPKGASLAVGLEAQGGKLPERAALAVLSPVLEAVAAVHEAGLLHEGISPEAIFLAQSGEPMLYRFRSAQVKLAEQARILNEVLIPGYAPPEQYVVQSGQGPWTDVYACAATLYRILTGETLPDAKQRLKHDEVPARILALENVSSPVAAVMQKALALDPGKRARSVKEFVEMLSEKDAAPAARTVASPDAAGNDVTSDAPEEAPGQAVAGAGEAEPGVEDGESRIEDGESRVEDGGSVVEDGESRVEDEKLGVEDGGSRDEDGELRIEDDESRIEDGEPRVEDRDPVHGPSSIVHGPTGPNSPSSIVSGPNGPNPDAPPVPSSALRKNKKKRSASLFVGGGIAAAILFAGAAFLVVGNGASQAETAQAAFYMARADSLYENENYQGAVEQYRNALTGDPGNEYASRRLEETRQLAGRTAQRSYRSHLASGDSLLALGDSLMALGEPALAREMYAAANQTYIKILNAHPGDEQALSRMRSAMMQLTPSTAQVSAEDAAEIVAEDEEVADAEAMRQNMMTYLWEEGDVLLADGDLDEALEKYRAALNFGVNDTLQSQITEIEAQLSDIERREAYAAFMEEGSERFQAGEYAAANDAFVSALAARPGDRIARQRLDQVNAAWAVVQENQSDYQRHRDRGDQLASSGDAAAAIAAYEQALNYASRDSYATARIAELQEQISAAAEEAEAVDGRTDERGIYVTTDTAPKLLGTLAELHEMVEYPDRAYRRGIEGRVYVQLAVNESGEVFDADVIRGIGGGCDEEALRVLRSAEFEAALVDGSPVRAYATLFIQFSGG